MVDEFQSTDRFEIRRVLGKGGMGVVYEAFDRDHQTPVALKTLQRMNPDELIRFKTEFRSLSDIAHQNLVGLRELIEDAGRWFFTMDLVDGTPFLEHVGATEDVSLENAPPNEPTSAAAMDETSDAVTRTLVGDPRSTPVSDLQLSAVRRPAAFDAGRLRSAFGQLVQGLIALHDAHKVHRDIKPSNVLVANDGRVVILDFGIVAETRNPTVAGLDQEGSIIGTPAFMAPEQAFGQPVGPAADWYSCGVLLYLILTGRTPFAGSVQTLLARKIASDPPPPDVWVSGLTDDLSALCMRLLARDPSKRATGHDVLQCLAGTNTAIAQPLPASDEPVFVGRHHELMELMAAREAATRQGLAVLVEADSGMGKSALVRQFTLALPSRVLCVRGRCYERESVPYKALDGVMDALSLELASRHDVAHFVPPQFGLLERAFPVLARVDASDVSRRDPDVADPQERRLALFSAVRALLTRFAQDRPLVIAVDDLQWADDDSLALLQEIMRPPAPAGLLLVGTMRKGQERRASIAGALGDEVRVIDLRPLSPDETRQLAHRLAAKDGAELLLETVANESGGHPMFVEELVRHVQRTGHLSAAQGDTTVMLDAALRDRVAALDAPGQLVVELVAIAGSPMTLQTIADAAEMAAGDCVQWVTRLRAAHLVRTTGPRMADLVEPYHDRIRESTATAIEPGRKRGRHAALAVALENAPRADAQALATHWHGAGQDRKAAAYALMAGDQAASALAFDRAAELYRWCSTLDPPEKNRAHELLTKLGDALANAGRGREAAETFQSAAEHAPADLSPVLLRRSAEQFFRGGEVQRGARMLRVALAAAGVRYPPNAVTALLWSLWHRASLTVKGLQWTPRDERDLPAGTLERIDLCWTASSSLGVIDLLRGFYFSTRYLTLALPAGEPNRVTLALMMEGHSGVVEGGRARKRGGPIFAKARAVAAGSGQPYLRAWGHLLEQLCAMHRGHWRASAEHYDQGEQIFRTECVGALWEIEIMRFFLLQSVTMLGDWHVVERLQQEFLAEARRRDNLLGVTRMRLGYSVMRWLASDQPATALQESADAVAGWWRDGRHLFLEHGYAAVGETQARLYAGDATGSMAQLREVWGRLRWAVFLQIPLGRFMLFDARARSALALGIERRDPRLLNEAERFATRLARAEVTGSVGCAELIRGRLAAARGDFDAAQALMARAADRFTEADMGMHRAATDRRRGELLGGSEGAALVASATAWMLEHGARNPERATAMLAP